MPLTPEERLRMAQNSLQVKNILQSTYKELKEAYCRPENRDHELPIELLFELEKEILRLQERIKDEVDDLLNGSMTK